MCALVQSEIDIEADRRTPDPILAGDAGAVKGKAFTLNMKAIRSHAMIMCRCGDVFRASGSPASVQRRQKKWEREHADCTERPRPDRKVFWLSFCDPHRPKGQQFLGAALVEVTAAEAEAVMPEMLLRFPFAEPEAEWIAAASRKAHHLGCNPGGEMASIEIEPNNPNLARYRFGVLMDRATIEALDRQSLSAKD